VSLSNVGADERDAGREILMSEQGTQIEPQLTNEQLRQLQLDVFAVQQPYIKLLADLYARALPSITVIMGQFAEFKYSSDVELQASWIRYQMVQATEGIMPKRGRDE
jgi:hypothetical protein